MGIFNLTPDSNLLKVIWWKLEFLTCFENNWLLNYKENNKNNFDLIDIGAESTRPGAKEITIDEE
jgi:dihydropteroate synthase